MDLNGRFALRLEFTNIDTVFPEEVAVSSRGADHFHRPDEREDGVGPACMGRKSHYSLVDSERAVAHGLAACRNCYEPVFEYLARQPDSPVEYREGEPDLDDIDAIDGEALADGGSGGLASAATDRDAGGEKDRRTQFVRAPAALTTRTETVRIKTGASKVYHAPAANGTLCGKRGAGYRSVQFEAIEGHYRPCEDCFDLDE
jgi:hypothetical protein